MPNRNKKSRKAQLCLIFASICLAVLLHLPVSATSGNTDGEVVKRNIIYSESFSYPDTVGNENVESITGFRVLSNDEGEARRNSSAVYSLWDGRLRVNNHENVNGNDSFLLLLDEEDAREIYEDSFSLQYELEYTSCSDNARYLAIATHYNKDASANYSSFQIRSAGYAESRCRVGRLWHDYDVPGDNYAPDKDDGDSTHTLLYKLTGESYDGSVRMNNISLTVRVEYEKGAPGPRAYVRNNGAGGDFVLISEPSEESAGHRYYTDGTLEGRCIVLAVGGAVDGYIDNIVIYRGVGEPVFEDYIVPPLADGKPSFSWLLDLREAIGTLSAGESAGVVILLGVLVCAALAAAHRVKHTETNEDERKRK